MSAEVANRLMELAGGDPFVDVRQRSEVHQRAHGCGLHNAGGPQMQLVAALVRTAGATRVLDLGCGLGYSTLWIASAVGPDAEVIGIDADETHVDEATEITASLGYARSVRYLTGHVADVLPAPST